MAAYKTGRSRAVGMDRHRIGELIKIRRQALGKVLRQVPGVPHSTLGQVEAGNLNVTVDTLAQIAAALDAHWEIQLVGGAEVPQDERTMLVDRLAAIVDLLDDVDIRLLRSHLQVWEEAAGGHASARRPRG